MSHSGKSYLGIDLGGSNVRALVMDDSGGVMAKARRKLGPDLRQEEVCRQVVALSSEVLNEAGESFASVAAAGIGVAAQVRGDSGVLANAPNLGWREVDLGTMLYDNTGRCFDVVNDLDAIAWAEKLFGAAKGHDDVMVVFCGTGVGGGLVLGAKPFHGAGGFACEIGHVKVAGDDGLPCGCGSRGCLEAYLGGKNLSDRLVDMAKSGWQGLLDLSNGDLDAIHPGMLETLSSQGDPQARELMDELGDMLGDVLANAVTLLNLSALVLGGTVLKGCQSIRSRAVDCLRSRALSVSSEDLLVLEDTLGDWAGAMGAGALQF